MPSLRLFIDKNEQICYILKLKKEISMRKGRGVEKKASILRDKLGNLSSFTVASAKEALEEKDSTLYWSLWNLSEKGYIKRIGKGIYSFERKEKKIKPLVSNKAKKAWKILTEAGSIFFISGLDILSIFAEHIPDYFPTIIYVDKNSHDETLTLLTRNNLFVTRKLDYNKNNFQDYIIVYPTNELIYSDNGFASFEKAFIDLYYEITRNDYPLSLQELVRIYLNIKRRTFLDTSRLIKIASRRNIQYDIRYIVENEYITDEAKKFVNSISYEL